MDRKIESYLYFEEVKLKKSQYLFLKFGKKQNIKENVNFYVYPIFDKIYLFYITRNWIPYILKFFTTFLYYRILLTIQF